MKGVVNKVGKEPSLTGWYTVMKNTAQVDMWLRVTKKIAECVGQAFGKEMAVLVSQQKETTYTAPSLPDGASRAQELMWSKDYDMYLKKKNKYEEDKARVFALILSRCEEPMKNRLESEADYDEWVERSDVAKLIRKIKQSAYDSSGREYAPKKAAAVWKQLAYLHQYEDESLIQYHDRFMEMVDRVEEKYGSISPSVVVGLDKSKKSAKEKESKAREEMLVVLFMEGGHRGFKPMLRDLLNSYAMGTDNYPETIYDALQVMMVHQEGPVYKAVMKRVRAEKIKNNGGQDTIEASFTQMSKTELRTKGLCFNCGDKWQPGHKCKKVKEQTEEA